MRVCECARAHAGSREQANGKIRARIWSTEIGGADLEQVFAGACQHFLYVWLSLRGNTSLCVHAMCVGVCEREGREEGERQIYREKECVEMCV